MVFAVACQQAATSPSEINEFAPPAPSFDQGGVPNDGNGNKLVIPVDIPFQLDCGGGILDGTVEGWVQVRFFGPNNRNLELGVVHLNATYTNAAGETFVFRDIGVDRVWVASNGDIMLAQIGRVNFTFAAGNTQIGRIVLNLTTGQVESVSGRSLDNPDERACDVLT